MSLPFRVEALAEETEPVTEKIAFTCRNVNRKNHHGRLPLPDHIPIEEIFIEPEEDVTGQKCIGQEIIGKLHTRPIDKCIAGPGLLAHIHVSKFVYHIPFYRQVQRLKTEHQVTIPRSTIDSWQTGTANLVWSLYEELKRQVLGQGYIQLDETPIKVLDQ